MSKSERMLKEHMVPSTHWIHTLIIFFYSAVMVGRFDVQSSVGWDLGVSSVVLAAIERIRSSNDDHLGSFIFATFMVNFTYEEFWSV